MYLNAQNLLLNQRQSSQHQLGSSAHVGYIGRSEDVGDDANLRGIQWERECHGPSAPAQDPQKPLCRLARWRVMETRRAGPGIVVGQEKCMRDEAVVDGEDDVIRFVSRYKARGQCGISCS